MKYLSIVADAKPRRGASNGEPLECRSCGSRTTMDVFTGRTIKAGRISKGTRQVLCAHCKSVILG